MMRIVRCDRSHDAGWNQFVHACSRASFYHRAEWRDINERCFGHRTAFLAALDGDRFVGVFPLVQLKSVLFGNVACSMPFVNYGGPAAESEAIQQQLLDAGAEVAEDFIEYLVDRHQLPAADGPEGGMPLVAGVDPCDPVDRVGEGASHALRLGVP